MRGMGRSIEIFCFRDFARKVENGQDARKDAKAQSGSLVLVYRIQVLGFSIIVAMPYIIANDSISHQSMP